MVQSFFYVLVLAGVFLATWVGTQQLIVATLAIDYAVLLFYINIPPVAFPFIALANIVSIAVAILWRPFAPKYAPG